MDRHSRTKVLTVCMNSQSWPPCAVPLALKMVHIGHLDKSINRQLRWIFFSQNQDPCLYMMSNFRRISRRLEVLRVSGQFIICCTAWFLPTCCMLVRCQESRGSEQSWKFIPNCDVAPISSVNMSPTMCPNWSPTELTCVLSLLYPHHAGVLAQLNFYKQWQLFRQFSITTGFTTGFCGARWKARWFCTLWVVWTWRLTRQVTGFSV